MYHVGTSPIYRAAEGLALCLDGLQFLATGFSSVEIQFREIKDPMCLFGKKTQEKIKMSWQARLKENPNMFNDPMASMTEFCLGRDGILRLALQTSRFDIYDALSLRRRTRNKINFVPPLDRRFALPISMGAVTVTSDNTIVFGIGSSKTVSGAGRATILPTGYLDPTEDRLTVGDPGGDRKELISLEVTTLRELAKEIGIRGYSAFRYFGLVYDGVNPMVTIGLKTNLTSFEVRNVARDMGHEVERFHFVPYELGVVKDFFLQHPPTQHTAAAVSQLFSLWW